MFCVFVICSSVVLCFLLFRSFNLFRGFVVWRISAVSCLVLLFLLALVGFGVYCCGLLYVAFVLLA